jgi:hypothetical protein
MTEVLEPELHHTTGSTKKGGRQPTKANFQQPYDNQILTLKHFYIVKEVNYFYVSHKNKTGPRIISVIVCSHTLLKTKATYH